MEVPIQLHHIIFHTGICGVVYLCQFEGSLKCIYMGLFGLFIHSDFGDGFGPVDRITILWIPYYTFGKQSLFEWTLHTV